MLNVGKYYHTWSYGYMIKQTLGFQTPRVWRYWDPQKPTQKAKPQQVFGRLGKQMFHQNSLVVYQICLIFNPEHWVKWSPWTIIYYIYIYMICFKCVMKNHQAGNLCTFTTLRFGTSTSWHHGLDLETLCFKDGSTRTWRTSRHLDGGFKYVFNFHPYLGRLPILTNIFQVGWIHQLVRHIFLSHLLIVSESIPCNLRTESQVSCVSCY